jgi:hypothetical protein
VKPFFSHQARIDTAAPDHISIVREDLLAGLQQDKKSQRLGGVETLACCWLLWRSIFSNTQQL